MSKKNLSLPKIKSLVMDAVKEGIPEKKIFYDISPNWYRYFHYESNPLDTFTPQEPLEDDLIELFINREVEMRIISSYFGSIKTIPYNMHIAIIGSKGIGKHTTLKIISKIIQESFPDISFEYYNLKTGKDFKNNSDLDDSELINLDKQELDVRLISCSGKNKWLLLKRIDSYKKNTKILFTIWHTSDYPIQDNLKINKIIYFRNYNKDIITMIFERRIIKFLKEKEENEVYITSLNNNLIPSIVKAFQGNLRIIFLFFEQIHQLAKVQNINEIPLQYRIEYENYKSKYSVPDEKARKDFQRSGELWHSMIDYATRHSGEFTLRRAVTRNLKVSDKIFAIDIETGKLLWTYHGKKIANITVSI
ncbi:hypothetical protein LCGC14_2660020, partial [marine sediment metagenome]